ncbi:MAG TPA: thiamine-phosphate kinase [Pyrinomonadaceae bacterium]|nr:thiamine-phosphate kinase [Pyrinomonadaceae bacterium]
MKTEFGFIENLRNKLSNRKLPPGIRVGIGDDAAVLPKDSETDLVITADLLIEEIDFRLEWTKPEFIGHKALAVSLSDIAAMGAKPVWAMLSIGIPEKIWRSDFVEKFYEGWFALAKKFNVELIGGDVSKSPDKIVIDSIAAGETRKGKAVLRSTAKAGDLIFVTGSLGGAAAGLKLLETGENYETSEYKNLILRQLKPDPQTEIGRILGEKNLATSMIDLSDGLSSDLFHICRESNVGAEIFAHKIPVESEISNFKFQIDELDFALNGGEDFELLFTVDPKKIFELENELQNHRISRIGNVTANKEIIELIENEKPRILQPEGFRHF